MSCSFCSSPARYVADSVAVCGPVCAILLGNKEETARVLEQRRLPDITDLTTLLRYLQDVKDGAYRVRFLTNEVKTVAEMTDEPCTATELIRRLRTLGRGGYGGVYAATESGTREREFAIKLSRVSRTAVSRDFVLGADVTEWRLLRAFQHYHWMTPSLPILFGSGVCRDRDKEAVFNIMRRAHYGTLGNYMETYPQLLNDTFFKSLLFHITWAFAVLQNELGPFLHNDIKLDNILVDIGPVDGYTQFLLMDRTGETSAYLVPNLGVRFILTDFGLSSIRGLVDNAAVALLWMAEPNLRLNPVKHPGADVAVLANILEQTQRHHTSREFRRFIHQNFPFVPMQLAWPQVPIGPTAQLLTPLQLLTQFQFEDPGPDAAITDSYTLIETQSPLPEEVALELPPSSIVVPSIFGSFAELPPIASIYTQSQWDAATRNNVVTPIMTRGDLRKTAMRLIKLYRLGDEIEQEAMDQIETLRRRYDKFAPAWLPLLGLLVVCHLLQRNDPNTAERIWRRARENLTDAQAAQAIIQFSWLLRDEFTIDDRTIKDM